MPVSKPESDPQVAEQYLSFSVGSESFLVPIEGVVQILFYRPPTPIPKAPIGVEGVLVVRHQVVTVLDLEKRLFDTTTAKGKSKLILLKLDHLFVGFKVHQVERILEVTASEILPPPANIAGLEVPFLKGVVSRGDKIYFILDTDRILSAEEMKRIAKMGGKIEKTHP